jgi:DNA polymerase-1
VIIAFDCETYRTQPGLLAPPLVCGAFAWDRSVELFLKTETLQHVRRALEVGDIIVGHRIAYDFAVACAEDPSLIPLVFKAYAAGLVRDTSIRQELIDIACGRRNAGKSEDEKQYFVWRDDQWVKAEYSLAALGALHLKKDRSAEKESEDRWQLRYHELDGVPLEQWPADAVSYPKDDAADTLAIYYEQCRVAGVEDAIPTETTQVAAAWALHLMSCWGIRTDGDAAAALEKKLRAEKEKDFRRLIKLGFYRPRRATPDQVQAGKVAYWVDQPPTKAGRPRPPRPMVYSADKKRIQSVVERVYRRAGKTPPQTERPKDAAPTWKPQTATDKDSLQESGSYVLAAYSDTGGIDKALGYIPGLKQGVDHPVNVSYGVLVNSGRTSSFGRKDRQTGQTTGFNIQNLPSGRRVGGIRECIVPRPDFLWAGLDYKTLELCHLAQRQLELPWGFSHMAVAIREGKDLHSAMAANLIKVPYEQIEAHKDTKGSREKRARDCAKVANFGFPGGLGPRSLVDYARSSYNVRITLEEAYDLKKGWLATWPEMVKFLEYASDTVGEGVATYRDPVTGYVRAGCDYCTFMNMHFQERAAFGAKRAAFRLAHEEYVDLGTELYGSRTVAFIHDEFDLETPAWRAHGATLRAKTVMIEEMQKLCPDVPVDVAEALSTRWIKEAKAKYVGGVLVPWA